MRRRGFTLTEVLVALVVLTSAILILTQGFMLGGRASGSSQKLTQAALLADAKMAELEAGLAAFNAATRDTFTAEGFPDYSYELLPESTTTAGLTQITLTVTWKEREQERTFALVRLLRERTAP